MALDAKEITKDCFGYDYERDLQGDIIEDANGEAIIKLPAGALEKIEAKMAAAPSGTFEMFKTFSGGKKLVCRNPNVYRNWRSANGFTSHLPYLA